MFINFDECHQTFCDLEYIISIESIGECFDGNGKGGCADFFDVCIDLDEVADVDGFDKFHFVDGNGDVFSRFEFFTFNKAGKVHIGE